MVNEIGKLGKKDLKLSNKNREKLYRNKVTFIIYNLIFLGILICYNASILDNFLCPGNVTFPKKSNKILLGVYHSSLLAILLPFISNLPKYACFFIKEADLVRFSGPATDEKHGCA
jgi:hypothetical protein